jgi:hypothetical protein
MEGIEFQHYRFLLGRVRISIVASKQCYVALVFTFFWRREGFSRCAHCHRVVRSQKSPNTEATEKPGVLRVKA